ncbi:hypothetical protein HED22_10580 [Thalassospira sp. HF15]|uniref:hypothetical protein n=1 Tax=Thalassospira sp. HF15 TaxID=2722755 RepID=UPI001431C69E|nr:hypothetical protein [Thalassospira sp. HF15]NIY76091.1 hypothetical protein [Thalassospira sp. HF15]
MVTRTSENNKEEKTAREVNKNLFPEFCFTHPLYEKIRLGKDNPLQALEFYQWNGKFDSFCPCCDRETVYFVEHSAYSYTCEVRSDIFEKKYFAIDFKCSRDHSHVVKVFILHDGEFLTKVGQLPSLADLHSGDLSKYRSVLDKGSSTEFYKANGLAAHGVGVGAFVYLRRVLERMVSVRAENAISNGDITREAYEGKRFAEKIKSLKGHLPDLLVENTKIYSVLSKGVHDLEEQECLEIFPAIRSLMLFILEEDLQNREKESKLEAAKKALEGL